jgi:Rieske Fe-S protein
LSLNRREFLRRVVAASGILITGLVSSWELIQKFPQSGASATGSAASGGQPPATQSTTQTVTDLQTVTVTEYASGQSTQQNSTSQQSTTSSQTSSSTSQAPPPGYVLVTPLSALAGRSSAYFNHPSRGLSLLLNSAGQWRAFSATCTHAPCTVQYTGSAISCPCHGGTYNPNTGAVTGGPPPAPLPELGVLVQSANLYVTA